MAITSIKETRRNPRSSPGAKLAQARRQPGPLETLQEERSQFLCADDWAGDASDKAPGLVDMFIWPSVKTDPGHQQEADAFRSFRQQVDTVLASWDRSVFLIKAVSALRGTLPDSERHCESQSRTIQDYLARLGTGTAAPDQEQDATQKRNIRRLRNYQLALDLFMGEFYVLSGTLHDLLDYLRNNGLKQEVEVSGKGMQDVPFADGGRQFGYHTRLFMHNLCKALQLILAARKDWRTMDAYQRQLPTHARILTKQFDDARAMYAELQKTNMLI
jgi:hypothetical protein